MARSREIGSRSIRSPIHSSLRGQGFPKKGGKDNGLDFPCQSQQAAKKRWQRSKFLQGSTVLSKKRRQFRKYLTPTALAESAAVILLVAYVFYYSWAAIPFLLPLAVPVVLRAAKRQEKKKRKEMSEAFKDMTASLMTELKAGYSMENSLRECWKEMTYLYGRNGVMTRELACIVHGMDNQIPVEELMLDFANRSDVEEIQEFAEVFVIARRSGGNLTQIMQRSITVIQSRMDTETEIETMIAGKKMEQLIMDMVPFVIILYLRLTSPGFFDPLYHNVAGVVIMTICLAVYLAAFMLSERIADIRV